MRNNTLTLRNPERSAEGVFIFALLIGAQSKDPEDLPSNMLIQGSPDAVS